MDRLYPIALDPEPSRRLWGGERLTSRFGSAADAPDDDPSEPRDPIGEAWLIYGGNRVATGPDAGATLGELAERHGAALLGSVAAERYGRTFPLLAKLIDAAKPLSVQVHPDDAWALSEEAGSGHLGKAEAWLVLDADPGATIYWGFSRDVTADEVRAHVADASLEDLLNRVPVAPGDVIFNPPGTVHAIGAGVYLFEIQQASDLTYRLYDYDRRGADGKRRELHLDAALAVADLRGGERAKPAAVPLPGGWTRLVASPWFVLDRHPLGAPAEAVVRPTSCEVVTLVSGRAELSWPGGRETLRAGDARVIPAALGSYRAEGEGALLRSFLPADASS